MIKSIEIENFRGIQQGKLDDLTPLVVLVGPNGSGKSTVLDALLIAGSRNPGAALHEVLARRLGGFFGLRWLFNRAASAAAATVTVDVSETERREIQLQQSAPKGADTERVTIEVNASSRRVNQLEYSGSVSAVDGGYRLETPQATAGWKDDARLIVPWDRTREPPPSPNGHSSAVVPLHRLLSAAYESGRDRAAVALTREVVPGLRDIVILTERDAPVLHLAVEGRGSIPVALAGDGIASLVRILLEIANLESGTALIEEPELHEHPGAIWQTAKAIWAAVRRGIQVVVSTHSLELIDALLVEAKDDAELEHLSLYRLRLPSGQLGYVREEGLRVAEVRGEIAMDLR